MHALFALSFFACRITGEVLPYEDLAMSSHAKAKKASSAILGKPKPEHVMEQHHVAPAPAPAPADSVTVLTSY